MKIARLALQKTADANIHTNPQIILYYIICEFSSE